VAERRRLESMRRLADVQRAQKAGAEAALGLAGGEEAEALRREHAARRDTEAARGDWLNFLAEPGFAPDYARGLAGRILEREEAQAESAASARRTEAAAGEREEEWRLRSAQVKGAERSVRRLARKLARDEEQRRLAAAADLITFRWSRR
jgi:hypothetical protein